MCDYFIYLFLNKSIANFDFCKIDPVTRKSTRTEGILRIIGLKPIDEEPSYFHIKK